MDDEPKWFPISHMPLDSLIPSYKHGDIPNCLNNLLNKW